MLLTPKLISECTSNSNFSINYGDSENDHNNEDYQDNKTEGNYPAKKNHVQSQQKEKSFGVFMASFEHISHLVLVFLMSILNM